MDKCPHCGSEFDCERAWHNSDCQSEFRYVCGECDDVIVITVESAPMFSVDVPRCPLCNSQIDAMVHYCDECKKQLLKRPPHVTAAGNRPA
jgi:hypothetical protein